MPPSKKNRGKQRRKAKEKGIEEDHLKWLMSFRSNYKNRCKHGIPEPDSRLHDEFDRLYLKLQTNSNLKLQTNSNPINFMDSFENLKPEFPHIFVDKEALKSLKEDMLIQGTNSLLTATVPWEFSVPYGVLCLGIHALEVENDLDSNISQQQNTFFNLVQKAADSTFSSKNNCVRFFAERIHCDCLHGMEEMGEQGRETIMHSGQEVTTSPSSQKPSANRQQTAIPTLQNMMASEQQNPTAPPLPVADSVLYRNNGCAHGRLPDPPITTNDVSLVGRAYNKYIKSAIAHCSTISAIIGVKREFPEILEDHHKCLLLKAMMLSLGTSLLLQKNSGDAKHHAVALLALDHIFVGPDISKSKYHEQCRDIYGDGDRSVTSFYESRIPCECLKEMNDELKNHPKMGRCLCCKKQVEFNTLLGCARCGIDHYCSEECQESHWPEHRIICDVEKVEKWRERERD